MIYNHENTPQKEGEVNRIVIGRSKPPFLPAHLLFADGLGRRYTEKIQTNWRFLQR